MKTLTDRGIASILAMLKHYRQLASRKLIDNIRGNQCLLCLQPAQTRCLCPACLADLPWASSACAVCALPLPLTGTSASICFDCVTSPPSWQSAQAVFHYQFPIDRLIAAFKYHHQLALTDLFAELMAAQLQPAWANAIIVPVPLHPTRLRQRGYDQTLLLARALSRLTGLRCNVHSLRRTRDTAMQKGLAREARHANLSHAFSCADDALKGQRIVLIDDVLTTGATLSVLSHVLRNAGVESVHALVISRTLPA